MRRVAIDKEVEVIVRYIEFIQTLGCIVCSIEYIGIVEEESHILERLCLILFLLSVLNRCLPHLH
jgi:hypothetical protein